MYQICHEWTDQGDPVYRLAYQIVVEKKHSFFFIRLEKIWKTKIEKKRESEKTHQSFANNNNNSLDLGIEWVWGIYNKRLHDNEYG